MRSGEAAEGRSARVPRATYRFQFHEGFPLTEGRALVPYLHELGVSHVYASPLFQACPHSAHGYDTCDFNRLNPELGEEEDLEALVETLRQHDMGLVLDIVPNHMGIGGPENHWWWDVLHRGPHSPFARYFDIDWDSPDPRLTGKVLVPALDAPYDQVLARGGLRLEGREGGCVLRHGEAVFPINAASLLTVRKSLEEISKDPEALDELLQQQFYRLTWFRHGDEQLNYRRFFNVSSLAGLCVENEDVFDRVLDLARQWVQRGWLDGFRVDHPDGLTDPRQFLERLRKLAPRAWIIVEKILETEETLPENWPVDGSTGYDFLNRAAGLFIDPDGAKALTEFYRTFAGNHAEYPETARDKKRTALQTLLAAESNRLTGLLARIAARRWQHRDFTRRELAGALIEFTACFPVYRSYTRPETGQVSEADLHHIEEAAAEAGSRRADLRAEVFQFITDLLTLKIRGALEDEFVARFQQVSAPAMAKGVEDAAFYCYNRFAALNEVGGDPARFGFTPKEFHQFCRRQLKRWPASMLTTSTHDTKRSEDVRSRLWLLSEIPRRWIQTVRRWSSMNERHRRDGWPDANAEYLYYQTLVGAWPLPQHRALAYMEKASHEAGESTSWSGRNPEYDSALKQFITATLGDARFREDLERFVASLARPGCLNSLSQTLLKLTAPGVPDIYQGTELWDLSLVDPDNRRPVDFGQRQQLLSKAKGLSAEEAWKQWKSGLPKLWLLHRVLGLRARLPELFGPSSGYEPLEASGPARPHVVAFRRGKRLITVAPRLMLKLDGKWGETKLDLPAGQWRNELTGERIPPGPAALSSLLKSFPVALLLRETEVS